MRDSPCYERQDLASIFVETKHSRRAAETNLFQMAQQSMHCRRPHSRPPTNRRTNSLDLAGHISAGEELVRRRTVHDSV